MSKLFVLLVTMMLSISGCGQTTEDIGKIPLKDKKFKKDMASSDEDRPKRREEKLAKFKYYHETETETYYYDQNSIARPSKNIVKVWVKSVLKVEKKSLKEELEIAEVERAKPEAERAKRKAELEERLSKIKDPKQRELARPLMEQRDLRDYADPERWARSRAVKTEITLYEISCSERTYRELKRDGYDKEGEWAEQGYVSSVQRIEIEPEGEKATLYEKVCR